MKTIRLTLLGAGLVCALILSAAAQEARHLTVIHTFTGGTGTGDPGWLVEDAAGNFYGATSYGGNFHACGGSGCGGVYRLSPHGGGWTYTVLYEFSGLQGTEPSHLTLDAAGNIYGEFSAGGPDDVGGIFELSPTGSGPWKFTTLYSFSIEENGEAPNGEIPVGGLVVDSAGNLYGATAYGGAGAGLGTVFKLSPNGSGGWIYSVIYSIIDSPFSHPNGVVFDNAGNLYGASAGGDGSLGGVFELKPSGGGWTFVSLYSFPNEGSNGFLPQGPITLDNAGKIYGSTVQGGGAPPHDYGTIYELSPNSSGGYDFNVLYTFVGGNAGALDYGGVVVDSSGNLFGTALDGADNWGVVFELSPSSSGWTYGLVRTFTGGADGGYPAGLILDAAGNLYGTAVYGAAPGCANDSGCGNVFKLSAPGPAGVR
jgi:uncharacterized repeat protein (TIGR03803 family)